MKKITLLFTVISIFLMCITVASAAESIIWDFSDAETVARWKPSKSTTVNVTENGAVISGSGDDINLTYTVASGEVIELSDYVVFVVGYADGTCGGNLQFYHWTEGCKGNPRFEDEIIKDTTGIIKFDPSDKKTNPYCDWEGKATRFRLDPCRKTEQRSHTIRFVALFTTAAEYIAYLRNDTPPADLEYGQPVRIFNAGIKNPCFGTLGNDIIIEYADNYAEITALSSNVYTTKNTSFNVNSYPWVKVRLKNPEDVTNFEMYCASTATDGSITSAARALIPIEQSTDFVEYVFNIQEANAATTGKETVWIGDISTLRFDFMDGNTPAGRKIYVDYVAFFASEEEALDYVPDADTEIEKPFANSGKTAPTWIFNTEESIRHLIGSQLDINLECGVMHVTPTGTDPIITFPISGEEAFPTDEFPYFAYRHKTKSTVSTVGIFYTTTNLSSLTDASYSPFSINKTGIWQNAIVDLGDVRSYTKGNWTGDCTSLRLDPINGYDTNASIYIDRMGFFRTKADAYEFLSQGTTELDYTKSAVFSNLYQKAFIPENTLYKDFEKADFMLSSTAPEGEGENAVVFYTDENGIKTPVSRSYSTPGGYVSFFATAPGSYTIEYNDKEFSDIADHWAREHIDFVAAREVFGGTSDTEFSPDMPMTRGMFITVLGRTHGIDTQDYTSCSFSDVNPAMYYAPYIEWAKSEGLIAEETLFYPEHPITRGDAANILYTYLTDNTSILHCYDDTVEFTDIEQSDFETIDTLQRSAVLKGLNDTEFDPEGILTRGECALVIKNTIKANLGFNDATTEYTEEYFKRDRIRIGAWGVVSQLGTPENMKKIRDLGVDLLVSGSAMSSSTSKNVVFNYADKYGIEVHATEFPTREATMTSGYDLKAHTSFYAHHPSFAGHYFTDEPGSDDFEWLGNLARYYNEALPGKRPFVNLLPMYANAAQLKFGAGAAAIEYYDPDPELYRKHCQMWFENFDVDYICTDIYPLNGQSGLENRSTWYTYKDYCESINQIATVARENDAEFWCCIQTWGWGSGKRTPTELEYRWQCYAMLSYGCTGILLWSLTTTSRVYPSVFNVYTGDVTQPLYDDCKTVMWEMRDLSDTFIQYKNLGAFTVNCTDDTPWLKMTGEYTDFDAITDITADQPLLIGCFEKKEGTGHAFTVVNMSDLKLDASANLTFKADGTVTVYRGNEFTVLTPSANGTYTISLSCGEGVFVMVG